MPFHRYPRRALRFAAAFVSFATLPVAAQEMLEEIVVTADFRERALADVPASISVLDGEEIAGTATQHFEELVFAAPNVNWSGDGHRARYFQIRGVGELEQYEGAPNPSIGFLIDDIDFSGIGTIATLFDVERIEVLRGPQGSRYGANALGGLIYVQSTEPTEEPSASVRLIAAQDDALAGGIAIGGPLARGGNARYRVSAQHFEANGFRDNAWLDRDDTNGRQETTVRGKVAWDAGDSWSFRLALLHANIDNGYDAFAIDNSLTMLSDEPGRDAQRSTGASLRADRDGAITLTSLTTVADSAIDFGFDADWGNPDAWAPFTYDFVVGNARTRRTFSQELRLSSNDTDDDADWIAGLYALRLEDDLDAVTAGVYTDPDPQSGFTFTVDDRFSGRYDATSLALFGQLGLPAGENGRLSFGARVENRSVRYSNSTGLALSPGETMLGGELAYTHRMAESTTAYLSLARGFKAGGFNLGAGVPAERRDFKAESLWNLEAGIRSSRFDGRMLFDVVLFLSERRDQQVRTSFQLVPNDPASFVFFTDNAEEGRTLGLESELTWAPSESWSWFATVGLLDAEIREFGTPEVDLDGRDQAHAPGYTASVGGTYRHPGGFFARVDLNARDAFYFDYSHDQRSEAYELVNLRVGYESERWTIQAWARNLFDERYAVRGFFFGNEPPAFPETLYIRQGDPRQVGLTFDMRLF